MNTKSLMLFFAVCLLGRLPLCAQVTDEPASRPGTTEEKIILDPFEVKSEGYNGYTATQSSTGTRIAADVKTIPYAIDVTPMEIWNDFALLTFNQQETLSTVPGVSATESNGQYNVRGISNGGFFLRDGFLRFGRIDQSNVERIEVIKGPAGAIYGKTLPGGIINAVSKTAKVTPEYTLETQAGGLDLYRFALGATGPVVDGTLFYRVDLATSHENGFEEGRENKLDSGSAQLAWQMAKQSRLTVSYDYTDEFRGGRDGLDEAVTKAGSVYQGLAINFPNYRPELNTSGANTFSTFVSEDANLTLVHRFNNVFSLRLAGNWHSFELETLRGRGSWDPTTNLVWNRRPDLGYENRTGHAINLDLLSEFNLFGAKHHLLTTFDLVRDQRQLGPTYRLNPNLYRTATGYPGTQFIKEFDAGGLDPNPYPPLADFDTLLRNQNSVNTTAGVLINDRVSLLDGRLILSLGGRFDTVNQVGDDYVTGNHSDTDVDATTVQSGINYNLVEDITFFGNYSTSFAPQTTLDPTGKPFPNQKGKGYDTGFKFNLFDKQLFATANYFDITYDNIVQQEFDPISNTTIFTLNGSTRSSGVEVSLGGKLWRSLTIKSGVGYTKSVIQNAATNSAALIGLPARSVPAWTFGLIFKYDFQTGKLKGAYVGTNVIANSDSRYSDTIAGGRYRVRTAGYARFDFLAGYAWGSGKKRWKHNVSLVVKNAFDKVYATGGDPTQGNPRQFVARYSLTFR